MKKVKKKHIVLLLFVAVFSILFVLFMKNIPVKTFYYQTSTVCNSNLYGGGNTKYIKYTLLSGGLGKFNDEKSSLEAMNIPQGGCIGYEIAPVDYTTLELYLL